MALTKNGVLNIVSVLAPLCVIAGSAITNTEVVASSPFLLSIPLAVPGSIEEALVDATPLREIEHRISGGWLSLFSSLCESSLLTQICCAEFIVFGISLCVGSVGLAPTPVTLYMLGASWAPSIVHGQVWRLITPIFLHATLSHLTLNCLFQYRLGQGVESKCGKLRFGSIYFLSGALGNLLSVAMDPLKLSIGASTSAFGLAGATMAIMAIDWRNASHQQKWQAAQWMVSMCLVFGLSSLSGGVDVYGHLGGFFSGIALTLALYPGDVHPLARGSAIFSLIVSATNFSYILIHVPVVPLSTLDRTFNTLSLTFDAAAHASGAATDVAISLVPALI